MNSTSSWIIGADPACDLVVDVPSVSRRHCRLSRGPGGTFSVLDLGSTNGTYVNGQRVSGEVNIRRVDSVTLGFSVPMPWPEIAADPAVTASSVEKVVRVGREPDNDFVIDRPEVSGHHARVLIAPGGRQGSVEDLGSTNGTAVNVEGQRVTRAAIVPGDVLYFGPVAVPAETFLGRPEATGPGAVPDLIFRGAAMTVGRDPACDRVVDFPVVSGLHARFFRAGPVLMVEDLGSSNGTFVNARRVEKTATVSPGDLIGLGGHVLRFVDGTAGVVPIPPPTESLHASYMLLAGLALGVQSIALAGLVLALRHWSAASALFALGMAALWVGVSAAFFERLLAWTSAEDRAEVGLTFGGRAWSLGRAALVTLAFTSLLMGLVPSSVPAAHRWPAAFGVIGLTALVGTALGRAVVRIAGRLAWGIPAAAGICLVLGLLSVPVGAVPDRAPVSRLAAAATPTRWCFEALFLLSAGEKADDPASDPVAPYFPAETDRMGLPACASALLAMLGGLLYSEAVMALSRADRSSRAVPESR